MDVRKPIIAGLVSIFTLGVFATAPAIAGATGDTAVAAKAKKNKKKSKRKPAGKIWVSPNSVAGDDIVKIHMRNIADPPTGSHYKMILTTDDTRLDGSCTFIAQQDWVNPGAGIVLMAAILDGDTTTFCAGSAAVTLCVVPDSAPSNYTGKVKYDADLKITAPANPLS